MSNRADDDWHQTYLDAGYIYCRAHDEYHRPPECPIDLEGNPNPWWEDEVEDESQDD